MTEFTEFAKHRAAVYVQTVPRMLEIVAMTKLRAQQQQTLLMSGLTLQGGDYAIAAVGGPGHHTMYGNSSIAYNFVTMAGAQGTKRKFRNGLCQQSRHDPQPLQRRSLINRQLVASLWHPKQDLRRDCSLAVLVGTFQNDADSSFKAGKQFDNHDHSVLGTQLGAGRRRESSGSVKM